MRDIECADVQDECKGDENSRVIVFVEGAGGSRNPEATLATETLEASEEPCNGIKDSLVR